jgi:hypothetical protein
MHGKGQCKICDKKIMTWNFPFRPYDVRNCLQNLPKTLTFEWKFLFDTTYTFELIIPFQVKLYSNMLKCVNFFWNTILCIIFRHEIFHIVPGINPRPISALQLRCRAWYGSLGLIPGPIWKMSCKHSYNFMKHG